jgi:hypothetical protein
MITVFAYTGYNLNEWLAALQPTARRAPTALNNPALNQQADLIERRP